MPGYVFNQIEIENFKYISGDHPLNIQFKGSNIVILGGQNGYGKTTLFDAIELLLNGTIKHFNADLLNRGSESIGVLANDKNKEIIVRGQLLIADGEEVLLERKFKCSSEFSNSITWNNLEITQQELYNKLKTSQSMFDIGTYISQSQSLSFLQNKYKERKDQVSTLLSNPQVSLKIQVLQETQKQLKIRVDEQLTLLKAQNATSENDVVQLEEQIKSILSTTVLPGENIRLFPEKEYAFDVITTTDSTYATFIQPLKQIEEFIKNYDEFSKHIRNNYVEKALGISTRIYMALFYKKQIIEINKNQNLLNTISKCKSLLGQFKQQKWTIDQTTFLAIGIPQEIVDQLKTLLQQKQSAQKRLNESDQALIELKNARISLIYQFDNAVEQGSVQNDYCPLCGTKFADIRKAFADTEVILANVHEDGIERIDEFEKKISEIYIIKIIPALENILIQNSDLIMTDDALDSCKDLSTDELVEILNKLGLVEFSSKMTPFNMEEFSVAFEILKTNLQQCKKPVKIVLSDEKVELYKTIHHTYYGNLPPTHTLEQLELKRQYIANNFLNNYNSKLSVAKTQQSKKSEALEKYINKSNLLLESLRTLIKKYEDSYKDYQSILANAIRLPLMIYSGKIIQNYPLGLGIRAVVKTNQLVFEPMTKSGTDAFNILSTGQLNGLAIAILLSVRNVYGHPDGLDLLLIDDPLQTIDDISAISLADLLAQQHIGQIILSTHEDQKARLLKFKFEQNHLTVCEQNMQKKYLAMKQ